ncbi:MAG: serine hydrolase domain-containing protein [Acidimicrobiia bacterium]
MQPLPRATAVLAEGIHRGLHLGAQVYVSRAGETVADFAIGEARAGTAMTRDSMVTWFSMTKPSVAVAVAQQWERGRLELDDPVAKHVPEFAQNGKERITLRHLLTHTAGFRGGDQVVSSGNLDTYWEEVVAGICAVEPEEGWEPGTRAGYHLGCGMTMLAEVVRRVDGRPFEQYVRDEIFLPLGMDDCWVGMPPERHAEYGERIGTMHNTQGEAPVRLDVLDTADTLAKCIPGGGGRGPMHQLSRLYRALLGRGELDGARILSPQAVEAITARHRVGMFDETMNAEIDWGLGLAVDTFAMGRYASRRAFGHGGALSSQATADPEHDLVLILQTNGMCANDDHYQRLASFSSAVYVDLGLAAEDAVGRDKAMPHAELPVSVTG